MHVKETRPKARFFEGVVGLQKVDILDKKKNIFDPFVAKSGTFWLIWGWCTHGTPHLWAWKKLLVDLNLIMNFMVYWRYQ